jgi:uncharacterized pyridoxal phosphate-containing UPF0001 family protein
MQEIGAAWTSVREAVPDHVTVVAVSKTKPVEAVVAAHAAGARVFGENRVQELVGKHEALTHPDAPNHSDYADLHWHQIGTLQRNKVKYIAPFVSLIHAVDQVSLLDEIDGSRSCCRCTSPRNKPSSALVPMNCPPCVIGWMRATGPMSTSPG